MSLRQTRFAAPAPLLVLALLLITGCATPPTSTTPAPTPVPKPAAAGGGARYNLAGYSEGFKQGYADACGSPRRRSEERYKTDTDYRMGWNDGQSLCKK